MKLEPDDYKSDDSILDEDSDDDSVELVDSNTNGKRKPGKGFNGKKSSLIVLHNLGYCLRYHPIYMCLFILQIIIQLTD